MSYNPDDNVTTVNTGVIDLRCARVHAVAPGAVAHNPSPARKHVSLVVAPPGCEQKQG